MRAVRRKVELPFPPSVNNLFAGAGRRRVRTHHYREWAKEAGWHLAARRLAPMPDGPVYLTIRLGRPDQRRRDCSNCIKAIEDLLVEHRIIADDSLIEAVWIGWGWHGDGAEVELSNKPHQITLDELLEGGGGVSRADRASIGG